MIISLNNVSVPPEKRTINHYLPLVSSVFIHPVRCNSRFLEKIAESKVSVDKISSITDMFVTSEIIPRFDVELHVLTRSSAVSHISSFWFSLEVPNTVPRDGMTARVSSHLQGKQWAFNSFVLLWSLWKRHWRSTREHVTSCLTCGVQLFSVSFQNHLLNYTLSIELLPQTGWSQQVLDGNILQVSSRSSNIILHHL